jgi:diguanylate cyclase (GGDEF)-like protein
VTRASSAIVVGDRLGDVATFADEDLRVLEALANHASIALHNGRLADRLRQQVRENEHQALHDSLTGLGNRTLFHQDVLERTREGTRIAILLLDLDRFKEVNDALGHHTGDRLLEEVGMRLRQSLPEAASVARLGGDEFAVLLSGQAAEEAVLIGQRVRDELLRPFVLRGVSLTADASVGIALSPQHGCDGETLLQHADVAMYAAKSARSGVEVYSPGQDQHSPERLALIAELREALETGTLTVHYQPQADLDTSRIYGVEALVRWKHPERGFVPPDEIILVAERTGLIHQLTRYVLATALEQCRAWRDARTAIGVAVNLSPSSLLDVGFAQELEHLLEATGVPPAALTLEITENSIMADPDRTITVLAGLRALGIHLAVDDLGTGYASLSYLKRLPVDEIKIDKSFVMAMSSDPDDDAIVSAIVGLARRLGKRVVAEGVEDELTWLRLQRLGCDGAQGYWLSRPLEGRQVLPWLEAWSLTGPAAQLAGIGCPA